MAERTLVVGAYPPELVGIDGVEVAAIGIGLVDAAVGITTAIARVQPSRVILCGTCGAYDHNPGDYNPGTIVIVDRALWIEPAPDVEVPAVVVTDSSADEALCATLARSTGAPRVAAACHTGVTIDDALARRIASRGVGVEHMECFSVFRACAIARVPCAAILAIANRCGAGARDAWRANRELAESAAISAVKLALVVLSSADR